MHPKRQRKLIWLGLIVVGAAAIIGLVLYSLKQNINLYLTPSQINVAELSQQQMIRVGGIVVKNSVKHKSRSLQVKFKLTDYHRQVSVVYEGILPSLFREGQGIIVQGRINSQGVIEANEVLAKHDEEYRPPNIKIQD